MKITVEVPDEIVRKIKMRAAREDRKLKELIPELLDEGLEATAKEKPKTGKRVQFPLIHVPHAAAPGEELTPERLHEILLEDEVRWALGK